MALALRAAYGVRIGNPADAVCALWPRSKLPALASAEAMDGRHRSSAFLRRWRRRSRDAARASKARMSEHRDVRLNRQGLPI
ncbi:MAG TPA: hypothetical protein VFJ87_06165 [Rhodanobacteraceae bacterium]|nr:hypothetical protein [Rhodanobacteraceae bacterium]